MCGDYIELRVGLVWPNLPLCQVDNTYFDLDVVKLTLRALMRIRVIFMFLLTLTAAYFKRRHSPKFVALIYIVTFSVI